MNDKKRIWPAVCLVILSLALIIIGIIRLDIPRRAIEKIKSLSRKDVTVFEEKIDIDGLSEEFTIFYVADAHICLCDDRDGEIKDVLASRYNEFKRDSKGSEKNFSIVMDYVRKQKPDLVVFGGDLTDEASYASIEYVQKEIDKLECPYIFIMGNHDFMYGDEYFSEKAYDEYFKRFDSLNEVKEGCQIAEYGNFNILALDDCNNQVCEETPEAIEKLKEDGKPVIVMQHVPFVPTYGTSDLIEATNALWGSAYRDYSRVLMGQYANVPNESTSELIHFVSEEDGLAKIVVAGHVHFYHKDYMSPDTVQITVKPAFERGVQKITLY